MYITNPPQPPPYLRRGYRGGNGQRSGGNAQCYILLKLRNIFNNGEKFFNGRIKNFRHLFDLIVNWNYFSRIAAPNWGRIVVKLFRQFYQILFLEWLER
jgi:hypothetical protein